jgi:hypothetical protein
LQQDERAQVARALIQVDLRSDLTAVIQELYAQAPVDVITDDNIMAEIKKLILVSHSSPSFHAFNLDSQSSDLISQVPRCDEASRRLVYDCQKSRLAIARGYPPDL